jgi:hypothetical protein
VPFFGSAFRSSFRADGEEEEEEEEKEEGADEAVPGLAPAEEAVRQLLRRSRKAFHQDGWSDRLFALPGIEGEALAAARKSCRVPADERVLGLLDLSGDVDGSAGLVFGTRGLYYQAPEEMEHARPWNMSYDELGRREIVNHGTAVYLDNEQFLAANTEETDIDCEKLTRLLYEVRAVLAPVAADGKPTRA